MEIHQYLGGHVVEEVFILRLFAYTRIKMV